MTKTTTYRSFGDRVVAYEKEVCVQGTKYYCDGHMISAKSYYDGLKKGMKLSLV